MSILCVMSPKTTKPAGPSPEYRLAARVPMTMKEDVEILVAKLGRFKYRKRKLGIEGLVASAVLEFLDLPPDRQAAVLARNIPRVEAAFEADGVAGPVEIPFATEDPDPPARRKHAR